MLSSSDVVRPLVTIAAHGRQFPKQFVSHVIVGQVMNRRCLLHAATFANPIAALKNSFPFQHPLFALEVAFVVRAPFDLTLLFDL